MKSIRGISIVGRRQAFAVLQEVNLQAVVLVRAMQDGGAAVGQAKKGDGVAVFIRMVIRAVDLPEVILLEGTGTVAGQFSSDGSDGDGLTLLVAFRILAESFRDS